MAVSHCICVPLQMWQARADSRLRCGRDEPSPGADATGAHVELDDRLQQLVEVFALERHRWPSRLEVLKLEQTCPGGTAQGGQVIPRGTEGTNWQSGRRG
jgi:hypothetical protein